MRSLMHRGLSIVLCLLLLCGIQVRSQAAFAQFSLTANSNISVIGSPGLPSIWLDPAQAQLQPSANGYWHRFDFVFTGTDCQLWTYITTGVSKYKVYLDGSLINPATPGVSTAGSMPGQVTTSLDISIVNGASQGHNGAGFPNVTGLADTQHAVSIRFEATSGNTQTYLGKMITIQGANPSVSLPSHSASNPGVFNAGTFPTGMGGTIPITTSGSSPPAYIGVGDNAVIGNDGGSNAVIGPVILAGYNGRDASYRFNTLGSGTAIYMANWRADTTTVAQRIITPIVDGTIYPDVDLFSVVGTTGNPLDIIPLVTGLSPGPHSVQLLQSCASATGQQPRYGTLIVEGGTVDSSTFPAIDRWAFWGDSITLTTGQRRGSTSEYAFWLQRYMEAKGKKFDIVNRGLAGDYVTTLYGSTSGVSNYATITGISNLKAVVIAFGTNDFGDFGSYYKTFGATTNPTQIAKFIDQMGSTGYYQMITNLVTNLPVGTEFYFVGIEPRYGSTFHAKDMQADSATYFSGANMSGDFIRVWNNAIQAAVTAFAQANPTTYATHIHFYDPCKAGAPWIMTETPAASPGSLSASADGNTTTVISTTSIAVGTGIKGTSAGANLGAWSLVETKSAGPPYTYTVSPALPASALTGAQFSYNSDATYLDSPTLHNIVATTGGTTSTVTLAENLAVGKVLLGASGGNAQQYAKIVSKSGPGPYTYTVYPPYPNATAMGDLYDFDPWFLDHLHPLDRGSMSIGLNLANAIQPPTIFRRGNGGRPGSRSSSAQASYPVSEGIVAEIDRIGSAYGVPTTVAERLMRPETDLTRGVYTR